MRNVTGHSSKTLFLLTSKILNEVRGEGEEEGTQELDGFCKIANGEGSEQVFI